MIDRCQYCFEKYDACTCCKYCGFIAGTCQCHLEGDFPCTKFHPSDSYKMFHRDAHACREWIGAQTLEDMDAYVMRMYTKDVWPQRLSRGNK